MSYKRHFSAMEDDSLSGSAEHDDSIWIPQKYRCDGGGYDPRHDIPEINQLMIQELSDKYTLFRTKTFGHESRETAINHVIQNNEFTGLRPDAVSGTVDRENRTCKCKIAQN